MIAGGLAADRPWRRRYGGGRNGAVAQLVAHHTGSVGVRGSSPLSSTQRTHGSVSRVSRLGRPWRLVVADLDGTLVTGTTACAHLDAWIGHGPVIQDLERRFASGEITNTQVAESYAPFYR